MIYKCDKCAKEQGVPEQFWTVRVTANGGYGDGEVKRIQVCRPCLESLGIYRQEPKPNAAPLPPPPSVEDLVREIIRICMEPA